MHRAHPYIVLLALVALASSCTLINAGRFEAVVDCDAQPDGTSCGNQFDDGIARACMAGRCMPVVSPCADGGVGCDPCEDGGPGCEPAVDTSFTSDPGELSGPFVTFAFASSVPGSTFECSVDEAPFAACVSPYVVSGLASGEHVFRVRAVDPDGNPDSTPAEHRWTVDANVLDTFITSTHEHVTGRDVTFEFSGSLAVSFECRLAPGEAGFAPCVSPIAYVDLPEATHTFHVRAIDEDGNPDESPATHQFTVDRTGPGVSIAGSPAQNANVHTTAASFTFAPSPAEDEVTFLCRFDEAPAFTDCTSGFHRTRLLEGNHALQVKAVDRFGNEGATATRSWLLTPMNVSIYQIRVNAVPDGTRVRIQEIPPGESNTTRTRITHLYDDMMWVQQTDGDATPDFRGLTVYPMDWDPLMLVGKSPVLIGTVDRTGGNTSLVDATQTYYGDLTYHTSPRYTETDSLLLLREENEGLLLQTAGRYRATPGQCFGMPGHFETCWNGEILHVCLDLELYNGEDPIVANGWYSLSGILVETAAGYRFMPIDGYETSDACL